MPPVEPRGLVILSPCFTCTRDVAPVRSLARDLADEGWLACRFDPAGTGKSEGRFADATVSRYVADLVAVAGALRARAPRLVLAGHSLGGVVSILAAERAGASATITMASDARRDAFHRILGPLIPKARDAGSVAFDAGDGVIRPLTRAFLDDIEAQDALGAARPPLLVLHGDRDELVPVEAAGELALRGGQLSIVPGGGHLLARPEDRAHVRRAVVGFLAGLESLPAAR